MDQSQFDYKQDYYGHDVYADIPAAEQEVTVGSTALNAGPFQSASNVPYKQVHKIIRLPAGAIGGAQNLKTVKIISMPRQGADGRQVKAAVIPASMLSQHGFSGGQTLKVLTPGGGAGGHKFITLRTAKVSQGGNMTAGSVSNSIFSSGGATIISSGGPLRTLSSTGASGLSFQHVNTPSQFSNYSQIGGSSEDLENLMGGVVKLEAPDISAGPNFYDSPYARGHSPSGKDSGDEQDHLSQPGLKTNGLRKYARCVCDKVKDKGVTSYSEVADELVHEYAAEHPMIPSEQLHYIQKNIRRRVYDALNVLMALNVLQKEKKEIRWVGLPVNMLQECRRLEEDRERRQNSLRTKVQEIQDLILQLIAFKNLVLRNRIAERQNGEPSRGKTIELPFLVISTNRKTVIDCNIANDKLEYLFNFDQAFEIRDEVDTLRRMGLTLRLGSNQCSEDEYNQCLEIVPPSLRFYVEAMFERRPAIVPDFESLHQQRRMFVEARLAAASASNVAQGNLGGGNVLHHHHGHEIHQQGERSGGPLHMVASSSSMHHGHMDEDIVDSDVDEEEDEVPSDEDDVGSEVDVG